ncbi:hypothetical protein HK102_007204, partial [Quaeritorhiza haematococci]
AFSKMKHTPSVGVLLFLLAASTTGTHAASIHRRNPQGDGNRVEADGVRIGPAGLGDGKTSRLNPAFAPFDNKVKGTTNITGACQRDEDCFSACCDGRRCRAPDALKGAETCRDGLRPDFTNGLRFVQGPVDQAIAPGSGNDAGNQGQQNNNNQQNNNGNNNGNGNGGGNGGNGGDGNRVEADGVRVGPAGLGDGKTSRLNPAFAPFDDKVKGTTFITQACTRDEDCFSACCDGRRCRAPDALKGAETCRDGLRPDFTNGLRFVQGPVDQAIAPGSGNAAGAGNQGQNNNNNNNNNGGNQGQQNNNNGGGNGGDGNRVEADGVRVGPAGLGDGKTSRLNPAFAPFDNKVKGTTNITGACQRDEDCFSACCDGRRCRAPDALKGNETCRDGLRPDFSNGLRFVQGPVDQAI